MERIKKKLKKKKMKKAKVRKKTRQEKIGSTFVLDVLSKQNCKRPIKYECATHNGRLTDVCLVSGSDNKAAK